MLRRMRIHLLFLVLCFWINQGRAETIYDSHRYQLNNQIELGTNVYHFDYAEKVDPPLKSTEQGIVPGFSIGYTYNGKPRGYQSNSYFIKTGIHFSFANVYYDGSLQNGTPSQGTSGLSILNYHLLAGLRLIPFSSASDIKGYTGLHVRNWNRTLNNPDGSSFKEIYSSMYIPLGLRWESQLSSQLDLALDTSVNLPISGRFSIESRSSSLRYMNGLTNDLNTNPLWKIQLPISYTMARTTTVTLTPYFETLSFEHSPIAELDVRNSSGQRGTLQINEPASTTYQIGSSLSVAFLM